jgi:hypothetical protein
MMGTPPALVKRRTTGAGRGRAIAETAITETRRRTAARAAAAPDQRMRRVT